MDNTKQKLYIIIPMAGLGNRFKDYGFTTDKYLLPLDINLTSMIEKAITTLNIHDLPSDKYESEFIFITRYDYDCIKNILKEICCKYNYKYKIINISYVTEGPASTVYLCKDIIGEDIYKEDIYKQASIIISNSDQVMLNFDINAYLSYSENYDGTVLTYKPEYNLELNSIDKHSFAKVDNTKIITDIAEKLVLSNNALVGIHYFKKAKDFFDGYDIMVNNNITAPNGEYYISLVYKALLPDKQFSIYDISDTKTLFIPVGQPDDYFDYLYKYGGYKNHIVSLNKNSYVLYKIRNIEFCIVKELESNGGKYCACVLNNTLKDTIFCNIEKVILPEESLCLIVYDDNIPTGVFNVKNYTRRWFIGDFEPCLYRKKEYEVAYHYLPKGCDHKFHYHKEADEYNIIISGRMILNNREINQGQVFVIRKNEISCPLFLEDCYIVCVKFPSVPRDKYIL